MDKIAAFEAGFGCGLEKAAISQETVDRVSHARKARAETAFMAAQSGSPTAVNDYVKELKKNRHWRSTSRGWHAEKARARRQAEATASASSGMSRKTRLPRLTLLHVGGAAAGAVGAGLLARHVVKKRRERRAAHWEAGRILKMRGAQ